MNRSSRGPAIEGGRALAALAAACAVAGVSPALAQPADAASDLSALSIEDLANVDISSVSKADQPLSEAPAAPLSTGGRDKWHTVGSATRAEFGQVRGIRLPPVSPE